jgi:hypothetical protein
VHSVLTGPGSLTVIKEEDSEKTENLPQGKIVTYETAYKKMEKRTEKGTNRISTKSKASQKKGIFSFLFKKSKSMSDFRANQNENGNKF